MPSITIVSGSPGTGKTTISAELAKAAPLGVHIRSDEFYYFIADLIAPSEPESEEQNKTVIRAAAAAASTYARGGYYIVLDGIFGPWNLYLLEEFSDLGVDVEYIVLRSTLERSLERCIARDGPAIVPIIEKMHPQFEDVGEYERCVVQTLDRTTQDVLDEIERRRGAGDFRLER